MCDLEKASRMYKAKTGGVGCDGFHPKVLLETNETSGEIVVATGRNKLARQCFS